MLKIKLVRRGKKNSPTYRIVVQEAQSKVSGRVVDTLGYLVPKKDGNHDSFCDKKKYSQWVKKGAKPTTAVTDVLNGKYKYIEYQPKHGQTEESSPSKSSKSEEEAENEGAGEGDEKDKESQSAKEENKEKK